MHALLTNPPLVSAAVAWFLAQALKMLLFSVLERKISWRRLIDTGGLPSAHSTFVVGLAVAVGLHDGFQSTLFAVAFVFALVVMYDALSLRREAGKHADILNELRLVSTPRGARTGVPRSQRQHRLQPFSGLRLGHAGGLDQRQQPARSPHQRRRNRDDRGGPHPRLRFRVHSALQHAVRRRRPRRVAAPPD